MRIGVILISFLALFVLVAAWMLTTSRKEQVDSLMVGKEVAEFRLKQLGGDKTIEKGNYEGRYYLINIFASWCQACVFEHKYLLDIPKEIPILGVAWRDEEVNTKSFIERLGNPYEKIIMDRNGELVVALGVTGAPESFMIGANGKIIAHRKGPIDAEFIDYIAALIN